ncbi:hypothetical protein L596_002141 [Steinernema carpocapsae]|uniref:Uncharacterized protein n=1 Tax=Steinernema carpocapsae TaxID=34508 RepID=A0A4U8UPD2_STECR|nr:hypothetical protein L596_002141 [Steinernema carpocapsae]
MAERRRSSQKRRFTPAPAPATLQQHKGVSPPFIRTFESASEGDETRGERHRQRRETADVRENEETERTQKLREEGKRLSQLTGNARMRPLVT